jgi:predicted dehydrogenase
MDLRQRFGRPLRLACIGGGTDSWIGRMHRGAAEFDGWWRVAAGVFSGDPARSRDAGSALGLQAERCYGSVDELLAAEARRADRVDAVAIMTPNDTHHRFSAAALDAGLDVICDKPISQTHAQALDLVARVKASGRLFAITHGYSAYPMVRHARALVCGGTIGAVRLVQVEYIQGSLAPRVEDGPLSSRLRWVLDPARSGIALVMGMIGCHAQHLACFVTGAAVARVAADVGSLVPGRKVIDHVSALLEFDGGARGTFTATQAAAGAENDIRLRVYGEKGHVDWSHRNASYLMLAMHGEPARTIGRGDAYLPPEIVAAGRTPRGHPEGLREAFANLYAEVAQERIERELGIAPAAERPYPRVQDGAHTMAFTEACLVSHDRGGWVSVAR